VLLRPGPNVSTTFAATKNLISLLERTWNSLAYVVRVRERELLLIGRSISSPKTFSSRTRELSPYNTTKEMPNQIAIACPSCLAIYQVSRKREGSCHIGQHDGLRPESNSSQRAAKACRQNTENSTLDVFDWWCKQAFSLLFSCELQTPPPH